MYTAMTSRRLFAALAAAAVVMAVGYGVYWYAIAGTIRDGISQWAEARRAQGLEVAYEDLEIGGFPRRFTVTMTNPTLAGAGWRWNALSLTAEARPFALERIAVTLPETQRLDYGGQIIEATLENGVAHVTIADGNPESLAIEADGIALVTPRGLYSLARLEGLIRRRPEALLALDLDGRGLTLAAGANPILGREIAILGLTATIDEATLPEDLSAPALAAWSAAGGTVEIERLGFEWGAVEMAAEGTMSLDAELRPEAAFSAEIAGYGGLLDALAESGKMKPRDASFAKTFLNLMARKKSGRRVIETSLTAQNGKLYVGPLPLLRLAPVTAW